MSTLNETIQELVISNKKEYYILPLNNNYICLISNYSVNKSTKYLKVIDYYTNEKLAIRKFKFEIKNRVILKSLYISKHDVIALLFEDCIILIDKMLKREKKISTKLEVDLF